MAILSKIVLLLFYRPGAGPKILVQIDDKLKKQNKTTLDLTDLAVPIHTPISGLLSLSPISLSSRLWIFPKPGTHLHHNFSEGAMMGH